MVARLLWEQDAAGSNPVTSTTHIKALEHRIAPGLLLYFRENLWDRRSA